MCYYVNTSYIWTNHISVLCHSIMSSAIDFCFLRIFYIILKEKYHIRRNKIVKKRKVCIWTQYYYFHLPKIRVGRACIHNKKLSSLHLIEFTQALVFCQLTATMQNRIFFNTTLFLITLFNTTVQHQKYNIFDSMWPILDRDLHLY